MLVLTVGSGVSAQIPIAACPADTPSILEDIVKTQTFDRHVREYVTLHRLLETPLWPLVPTTDVDRIHQRVGVLRQRIQTARANATQGDLLTPEVAGLFRRIIAASLSPEEWQIQFADMADEVQEVEGGPPAPLGINMEWPEHVPFHFVPPQLLMRLPPLPPELQYRILGRALVLWDHHANLIVDILPGAFRSVT
jgi:hypothetical protein